MPLYDFECLDCGHKFEAICKYEERESMLCRSCGASTKPLISTGRFIPFHAGWYEHFTKEPIYIGNKQELKDACEKYGKGSVYLDDM